MRNLFRLKRESKAVKEKEINDTPIKDIRNVFTMKKRNR